jgi:glycosyltransferase involved in cell wall biosynthesis
MNQIKILMLIDHFGSGGAQRQIVNLAKGLKEQGYYVEFAIYYPQFRHFESEVKQAGIEINELKKSSRFSFSIIYSVCQLIKKKCFNLVISFLDTPNTYAEMASLFTGVKCIVSERSAFPGNKISLSRYIQCTLHTLADRIVVNSKSHQSALIKAFPFLKNKAHIIYNIIGDEFFAIGTNRLVSQNNKVLSVGTINVNKNCLLLIKAIHFIKQKYNIEINVTWAGKVGQSGDDKRLIINGYGLGKPQILQVFIEPIRSWFIVPSLKGYQMQYVKVWPLAY